MPFSNFLLCLTWATSFNTAEVQFTQNVRSLFSLAKGKSHTKEQLKSINTDNSLVVAAVAHPILYWTSLPAIYSSNLCYIPQVFKLWHWVGERDVRLRHSGRWKGQVLTGFSEKNRKVVIFIWACCPAQSVVKAAAGAVTHSSRSLVGYFENLSAYVQQYASNLVTVSYNLVKSEHREITHI